MSLNNISRVVLAVGLAVGLTLLLSRNLREAPANPVHTPEPATDESLDLQAVAETALAGREGAVVVLDPQTGRVLAVVNQELAFKTAFPPGSTIKPFTALAALRAGILTENTRIRCPGKYKRDDAIDACVHPPKLPAFNTAEAVAYSCNYFFATTGEHIDQEKFANMLGDFGFVVARGRWQPQSALGEGPFLQVTPLQMAVAYAALYNGGALLTPNYDGVRKVRAQLRIDDKERALLLEGMRGAVSFGTAAKADLDSLPVYIIGKTGTSTQLGGFRSQGWFAGIAFKPNAPPDTGNAQLVVVVYLNKAHGANAAELARPIFEEAAGTRDSKDDYCNTGPHYRWTDVIDSVQLANALRSDSRTDVGQNIRDFTVTLEWNVLKTSRFNISRSGSQFVFRGAGSDPQKAQK